MSTDQLIRIGRQTLRVRVRPGTGNGPPLVLANGIGVPLEVLDPFVDALDPAIEVGRFDAPGVGGSPTPPVPYTYQAVAHLLGSARWTGSVTATSIFSAFRGAAGWPSSSPSSIRCAADGWCWWPRAPAR